MGVQSVDVGQSPALREHPLPIIEHSICNGLVKMIFKDHLVPAPLPWAGSLSTR